MAEPLDGDSSQRSIRIEEPEECPSDRPLEHQASSSSLTRQHRANSFGKRLSGRLDIQRENSSSSNLLGGKFTTAPESIYSSDASASAPKGNSNDPFNKLVADLVAWINTEKASVLPSLQEHNEATAASEYELGLEKLENIISQNVALAKDVPSGRRRSSHSQRYSIRRHRSHSLIGGSSDTEYHDGDALVPFVDASLDNLSTLGYSGGEVTTMNGEPHSDGASVDGWVVFKNEILKLTHTLKLKGWRRVPLSMGPQLTVHRLSGAMTNAVYVVSPPENLPQAPSTETTSRLPRQKPNKILLRVYGPYVEHLIDRDSELRVLRRLARKNIGPRMLGTFRNGRFEEYLQAVTLTAPDLRAPAMTVQIAKRMRELHDGIELEESEKDAGPFVWQNWNKWVERCEEITSWLDQEVKLYGKAGHDVSNARSECWRSRGLVCGVEWPKFRKTVENYRRWVKKQYGGKKAIRSRLAFCHNDTQYGNLLRLEPAGESPLLLPSNQHKRLVVIDFEYANANPIGHEFANHFTEWCYNYNSPFKPHDCVVANYPTPEQQHRFLKAYIQHKPQYPAQTPPPVARSEYASSNAGGSESSIVASKNQSSTSLSAFMVDSRGGPNSSGTNSGSGGGGPTLDRSSSGFNLDRCGLTTSYEAEERERDERLQKEIDGLMHETRLWRVTNSAQWVIWGIIQAKLPGMEEGIEEIRRRKRERDRLEGRKGSGSGASAGLKKIAAKMGIRDSSERGGSRRRSSRNSRNGNGAGSGRGSGKSSKEVSPLGGTKTPTMPNGHADPAAAAATAATPEAPAAAANGPVKQDEEAPASVFPSDLECEDADHAAVVAEAAKAMGPPAAVEDESETDEGEFDYLGYSQERVYFFWGDLLEMGLVKEEELPAELLAKVKRIKY